MITLYQSPLSACDDVFQINGTRVERLVVGNFYKVFTLYFVRRVKWYADQLYTPVSAAYVLRGVHISCCS